MQQDWPSFSNIKSLFAHIQAQAQGDLEKLEGSKEFKKQVMAAPTATTATTASSGDGAYSLQGYEHLRWFLVADDLKRRGFDALNIEKLVSPILPRLRAAGPDATPTTATDMSHYAKQRNELIRARTGTEMRVPRYLGLACRSEAEQLGILEVMRRNALRYLQSAAAGIGMIDTSGVVAATGGVKGEKVKGEREKARPAATAATDGEELTCSTGTCSLRSRPAVAVTQPVVIEPSAPVVLSSGKILSGPGHTFRPEDLPSSSTNPATTPAFKFHQPPKKIMKLVGQAVKEWNMIEEGDRLLLGLSGGKDSLALLHVLHALQKRAPVKFTFACATGKKSFLCLTLLPIVVTLLTYAFISSSGPSDRQL